MRRQEARSDPFRLLAKREGFRSRAAYKLLDMDRHFNLLQPGARVVDLGSAPGSWLQVAASRVGPQGLVVGVDISAINVLGRNIRFIQADIRDPDLAEKLEAALGARADVLLLDAAPKFTGVPEVDEERQVELITSSLALAERVLKRRGKAIFKALQGERSREVGSILRSKFERVILYRPAAVRKHSREFYFVCLGFRG